jgi:hypothetical protein
LRALTRREFIGGAAAVAAAAALPASGSVRATVTSLAGATVNLQSYPGSSTYVQAADTFDGYLGQPMATTLEKVFLQYGQLPAKNPPAQMTQLAAVGCQFLLSVEPSTTLSSSEQAALAKCLAMLNKHGFNYRVVLYSECNDFAFSQSNWLAYWSYYAPVIQDAGVLVAYDPGCSPGALSRAESYFPSNPTPDEMWMDYYATAFRSGTRLAPLIAVAQAAGVPTGVAEWGWTAGKIVFTPMTMPWWNAYCAYLVSLVNTGNLPLGAIYFDAVAKAGTTGVIRASDDPRIPGIQSITNAIQAS